MRAQSRDAWLETANARISAYQGLLKAQRYGLEKLPGIVFDGHAVVYGLINLNQALGYHQCWKAGSS